MSLLTKSLCGRNGVIIFIGTMPELWCVPVRWFCNLCHVNDAIMRVYVVIKYMEVVWPLLIYRLAVKKKMEL